jgi:hypothetical protein
MAGRMRRSAWIWVVAPILGAFVGLYYAVVGRPTTPMTAARADRLFGQVKRYLFFDRDDSLLKHWVEEFHIMP